MIVVPRPRFYHTFYPHIQLLRIVSVTITTLGNTNWCNRFEISTWVYFYYFNFTVVKILSFILCMQPDIGFNASRNIQL